MNHMQRYLADEVVEDYQEGRLTRRQALKMIASVTGSLVIAQSFLAACAPPPAQTTATAAIPTNASASSTNTSAATLPATATQSAAADTAEPSATAQPNAPSSGTVLPDDPAITAAPVEFDSSGTTINGYLAQAKGAGPFPCVLVCHENRGLTDHIKDVTRRLAKAGYVALAVDLLSRQGGSAKVGESGAPGALGTIDPNQFVTDFVAGWHYLQTQSSADAAKVGMVGFCFGGGVTWLVAAGMPELKAAVPFYGPPPPVDQVPKINAAVLAIYGGLDQRITSSASLMETTMQTNKKTYAKMIYPDADHAFFNDTGSRYNAAAAQDAWAKTLAWFQKYLV